MAIIIYLFEFQRCIKINNYNEPEGENCRKHKRIFYFQAGLMSKSEQQDTVQWNEESRYSDY